MYNMSAKITCFYAALLLLLAPGCAQQDTPDAEIVAMEQRLAQAYTFERSDSLVNLYQKLVKADRSQHTRNLRYLTRAAEIQVELRKNAAPGVRWIMDALSHHAEGQDLTEIIGLSTRIWRDYKYKSTVTVNLGVDDIDKLQETLIKNAAWIDSALVRLDRKIMSNLASPDSITGDEFIQISEGYAFLLRNGDKKADLLSKAAGLAKSIGNFNKAIQLYYQISNEMPEHPKAHAALFLQGFIYENDLNNPQRAKSAYEEFLKRYPNDPDYGDDVAMSLKNLGKTPEQLIKEFEQKGQ
jgi:tetratricopeptide (TPR) repeat protein